jgi:diadenosine tetraphosphate (Ap4A) HIT family hydrolase
METKCPFCDEVAQSASNIFYTSPDGLFAARWDLFALTPGHVEIIPTRHVQYLEDLTDDETDMIMRRAREVIAIIRETNMIDLYETLIPLSVNDISKKLLEDALKNARTFKRTPDGFNLGINDGAMAGQSVPHLHLHIIPRYQGDIENPRGGIRNIFTADTYSSVR